MDYQVLIKTAEEFVKKYMNEHENQNLIYHNLLLTQNTVSVADEIAKHYGTGDKEFSILITAAWFLYSGYYKDAGNHNVESANLAEDFLKNAGIEEGIIRTVKQCILAIKNPRSPGTLLEKIICDADTFYFGTENFFADNKLKRKEYALINNPAIDKNAWMKRTIEFLESHQYYTDYIRERLLKTKMENLEKLKKKISSPTEHINVEGIPDLEQPDNAKKENKKTKKKDSPERTIETMFRTTAGTSQRLSSQADTKAHILISVNSIIISVLLGVVVRRMNEYSAFTIPVITLLTVNLVTIIFSILATRPNIRKGVFNETDLQQNKVNLLFFGNFFNMSFDDYSKSMLQIMDSKKLLYLVLLKNLYEQGVVLSRKYRRLKTAYTVFMFGLIISVIAFFIASAFFSGKPGSPISY